MDSGSSHCVVEGDFQWVNKAQRAYTNWQTDAPSSAGAAEDRAILDQPANDWNDLECNGLRTYACECYSAPP